MNIPDPAAADLQEDLFKNLCAWAGLPDTPVIHFIGKERGVWVWIPSPSMENSSRSGMRMSVLLIFSYLQKDLFFHLFSFSNCHVKKQGHNECEFTKIQAAWLYLLWGMFYFWHKGEVRTIYTHRSCSVCSTTLWCLSQGALAPPTVRLCTKEMM